MKTRLRMLLVLVAVLAATWSAGGTAQAHTQDGCLLSIHAGGIQQHIVCA